MKTNAKAAKKYTRTRKTAEKVVKTKTFQGAPAIIPGAKQQLERQVATCMLFENTFYESGEQIAKEIAETCKKVPVEFIADLAIKARTVFKLRHVPLFLLAQLDQRRSEEEGLLARTIPQVVLRPDEMGELLSIIQKNTKAKSLKKTLSAQVKKGLAKTFTNFNEYNLAKWNRDEKIKLRDVLFLVHAKPTDKKQAVTWKKLIDGTLEAADTWEVALSAGSNKKETWERLLSEGKLGYMALLMNLRNMVQADVDPLLVKRALIDGAVNSKALPFRFVSAAKAAPEYKQTLSDALVSSLSKEEKLKGTTYVVIDVSGSMDYALSSKGELTRLEAASALATLIREVCEDARVFTFSERVVKLNDARGLELIDRIKNSQVHSGTYLSAALQKIYADRVKAADRIVVVTDEQTHDGIVRPQKNSKGYLINVAPYAPGLDTKDDWKRINGFSERVVDYIRWEESQTAQND